MRRGAFFIPSVGQIAQLRDGKPLLQRLVHRQGQQLRALFHHRVQLAGGDDAARAAQKVVRLHHGGDAHRQHRHPQHGPGEALAAGGPGGAQAGVADLHRAAHAGRVGGAQAVDAEDGGGLHRPHQLAL